MTNTIPAVLDGIDHYYFCSSKCRDAFLDDNAKVLVAPDSTNREHPNEELVCDWCEEFSR
jgi:hypothetical protein